MHRPGWRTRACGGRWPGATSPGLAPEDSGSRRPGWRWRKTAPPPALSLHTLGPRHGHPRTPAPAHPARAPARRPTAPTPAGLPGAAHSRAAGPGACAAGRCGQRGRVGMAALCPGVPPGTRLFSEQPEPRFEVTSGEREMWAGRQVTSCWRRGSAHGPVSGGGSEAAPHGLCCVCAEVRRQGTVWPRPVDLHYPLGH